MKSILTTLFVAIAFMAFSQDYMDKIAVASCECIDNVSDTIPTDQFNMELGLCMLEASMPYKKQLKKDHGIDFDKIESQGEKLGRLIGIRLASTCPNSLMRMVKRTNPELDFDEDVEIADDYEEMFTEGTVEKVETEMFVVISVKEGNGKISKYYWLSFVESDFDLTNNHQGLVGKTVTISYDEYEFFDPRLKEYRVFNVINALDAF